MITLMFLVCYSISGRPVNQRYTNSVNVLVNETDNALARQIALLNVIANQHQVFDAGSIGPNDVCIITICRLD